MNPEKRAEKIVQEAVNATNGEAVIHFPKLKELIAAELTAAVEEAERNMLMTSIVRGSQIRAEAYEYAAKTMSEGAKMYPGNKFLVHLFESLANRFRAKAKELE